MSLHLPPYLWQPRPVQAPLPFSHGALCGLVSGWSSTTGTQFSSSLYFQLQCLACGKCSVKVCSIDQHVQLPVFFISSLSSSCSIRKVPTHCLSSDYYHSVDFWKVSLLPFSPLQNPSSMWLPVLLPKEGQIRPLCSSYKPSLPPHCLQDQILIL